MTTTVEKLAENIGLPVDKLLQHLESAGINNLKKDSVLSESQKNLMLEALSNEEKISSPKRISLKRRSVTQVSGGVKVVSKKTRVYVKRDSEVADAVFNNKVEPVSETAVPEVKSAEEIDALSHLIFPKAVNLKPKPKAIPESLAALTKHDERTAGETVEVKEEVKPEEIKTTTAKTEQAATKPADKDKTSAKPKDKDAKKEFVADDDFVKAKDKKASGKVKEKSPSKPAAKGADEAADFDPRKAAALLRQDPRGMVEDDSILYNSRNSRRSSKKPVSKLQQLREESAKSHAFSMPSGPIIKEVFVPETITVSELATMLSIKAAELVKKLFTMGVMATINHSLDQDTAILLVEELGHKAQAASQTTIEDTITVEYDSPEESRSPVVTVMGHVDHGKTSLLDYIRASKVAASESGGITQHIGAYVVKTSRGNVTFLDTPGHAAFTSMRARGAKCTDLVILVVASDDGVMPQTVEAIQHAKAAGVPIIVAVNKMDKPDADYDRVVNELAQHEVIPEDWGGDTMFFKVSAKTGLGVDELLEGISIQAEFLELKSPVKGAAKGVVLEGRLDKGRGSVASILIQSGTLKKGDMLLAGIEYGRVRAIIDQSGNNLDSAGPSTPVEVLGLSNVPQAGDECIVVENEKVAKEVAAYRQQKQREIKLSRQQASKLEGLFSRMSGDEKGLKEINIVLKADVQGSVEALIKSLEELTNDEVRVKVISSGVGGINESDMTLALASNGFVIGFNVRADAQARKLAQAEGIELNYYSIIYEVVDRIKNAVNGMLAPRTEQKIIGIAEVRDVFRSNKLGAIAGCIVSEGVIKRHSPIRVLRNNVVIYEGELESLRRFRDDVNEVRMGTECGIGVKNYNDVKIGDQIEVFEVVVVNRV